MSSAAAVAYKAFTKRNIGAIMSRYGSASLRRQAGQLEAIASILPFRVNNYVLDNLIDWSRAPDDPMYRLTFPHPDMLDDADVASMRATLDAGATPHDVRQAANHIRVKMNPHPAGQMEYNVPRLPDGTALQGAQHKYKETVLFFPEEAQYCHSYCTYCFRWAQFVGDDNIMFAASQGERFREYLRAHPEISDVLFTGGDPMVMRPDQWQRHLTPLITEPGLEHVQTIRIGTKSLAWWPYRYTQDKDGATETLSLLEQVVKSGKHVALMAHFSHPVELSTPVVQEAIRLIRMTGAQIRCQAPLIRNVNDDPETWATMWREEVRQGLIPYYMFVERDTGARRYFEVPLHRCYEIFTEAYTRVSGLARTVRGPSMSATPGKVCVVGIPEVNGEKVFALKFLQARDPEWAHRIFFAKYDPEATWLDDLRPADGSDKFFFDDVDYASMRS